MTAVTSDRRDARPGWLRVLVWSGLVLATVFSLPIVVLGLVALDSQDAGPLLLCFGSLLLVSAVGGIARELAERRIMRRPPEPRLEQHEHEQALALPRDGAPTRISSMVLIGYAAALGVGALLTGLAKDTGWTIALALLAAYLVHLAAPHRQDSLAGGFWFTPTRLVHEHQGIRWQASWQDVTGAVPQQPMPVLVRADRVPPVERTGPRGRGWKPYKGEGLFAVDARHLAGGSTLAGYIITKALADPAFRQALGTPSSLPPAPSGG